MFYNKLSLGEVVAALYSVVWPQRSSYDSEHCCHHWHRQLIKRVFVWERKTNKKLNTSRGKGYFQFIALWSVFVAHTTKVCSFLQCKHANMFFLPTEPDWASYTLGIFVCLNCSGLHRNLPAVSKVKSTRLDLWEDSLVQVQACSLYTFLMDIHTFLYIENVCSPLRTGKY